MPLESTTWHPATDQLLGKEAYGDSSNDSVPWSIEFKNMHFDQFAFATGDLSEFIVASKDKILTGVDYTKFAIEFLSSSLRP